MKKSKKSKTPKEMSDKELCREYIEINKWIDNEELAHSYKNEYIWLSMIGTEMKDRGFKEKDTDEYFTKDGKRIKY